MAYRSDNPIRRRTDKDYEYQRNYQKEYEKTEAGLAAKKTYKEQITTIYLHLHATHDADILEFLQREPDLSKGGQVKALLREAINVRKALEQ